MAAVTNRSIGAPAAYYLFEGGAALLNALGFTLMLVLQVQVVGLSPFELVLMGTVLELTLVLFEIPTGVVADVYSRRRSVLIGAAVIGVSLLVQGLWPIFWPTLLAQALWGIGYTFISGAVQAWITDEVGEQAVQPVFTRGVQVALGATIVGTLLAGLLGQFDLRLPMVFAGVGYLLLAALLFVVMPETAFQPAPRADRQNWRHLTQTLRISIGLARRRPLIRGFAWVGLFVGLSSEAVDRLWTARLLESFALPPLAGTQGTALWFSLFALVGTVVSLVASLIANRLAARRLMQLHPGGLLAALVVLQVVGVIGFALVGSVLVALVCLWLRDAARALAEPVQAAWLNRSIESRARATTLSLIGQVDALGQVAGGPPLGALAARTSVPVGLVASAVVLAPAAVILARLGRDAASEEPVTTAEG